jgi:hypothetical protein
MGTVSSRMTQRKAEETDPGEWWVPEEVGRHPQRVNPAVREWHGARNAEGTVLHQEPRKDERTRKDVGRARNAEWNNEPRLQTGAASWKRQNIMGSTARLSDGGREAGSRDFHWATGSERTLWGVGLLRNERRYCTRSRSRKCRITGQSR